MKTLVFLGAMGSSYGIADALGASPGVAAGIAWAAALLSVYVVSRWRGYRAAFRVETHRAAAEQPRRESSQTYQQILTMAEGEAAEAAAKDPDAFVALFLAAAADEGVVDH
jgi:hypothetical protein